MEEDDDEDYDVDDDMTAAPLPKPPAGFVLDPEGKVLMVSNKRLVSIVSASFIIPRVYQTKCNLLVLSSDKLSSAFISKIVTFVPEPDLISEVHKDIMLFIRL